MALLCAWWRSKAPLVGSSVAARKVHSIWARQFSTVEVPATRLDGVRGVLRLSGQTSISFLQVRCIGPHCPSSMANATTCVVAHPCHAIQMCGHRMNTAPFPTANALHARPHAEPGDQRPASAG